MDKHGLRLVGIFSLVILLFAIFIGYKVIFDGGNNVDQKKLTNEDYALKQQKDILDTKLSKLATIKYEENDNSSALVLYTNKKYKKIVSSFETPEPDIKGWNKLVKKIKTISKQTPLITISVVESMDNPDLAYLVIMNGKIYYDYSKSELI